MSRLRRESPVGFSHFSTHGVPARQRIAQWEAHHASQLVGLRARPLGAHPLDADATSLSLPRLRLAHVTGNAHNVQRDATDIASSPVGGAVFYLPLASESRFRHHLGTATLSAERGIACDGDLSFSRNLSRGVSELVLRVPRQALREATGQGSLGQPTALDLESRGGPGRDLVNLAWEALKGRPGDWDRLEVDLLGLVARLIADQSGAHGHLAAALQVIDQGHRDPGLDAGTVARAIGVSERHLSRVMADGGHSLPQALLRARLATARAYLSDPAQAGAAMADIAEASGFRSQAQFSRSYARHFGISPLRDRRALLAA